MPFDRAFGTNLPLSKHLYSASAADLNSQFVPGKQRYGGSFFGFGIWGRHSFYGEAAKSQDRVVTLLVLWEILKEPPMVTHSIQYNSLRWIGGWWKCRRRRRAGDKLVCENKHLASSSYYHLLLHLVTN